MSLVRSRLSGQRAAPRMSLVRSRLSGAGAAPRMSLVLSMLSGAGGCATDESRAFNVVRGRGLRPPGPVAAPLASSLRATSRSVPPRGAFGRHGPAGSSHVGGRQVFAVTLVQTLFAWRVSTEQAGRMATMKRPTANDGGSTYAGGRGGKERAASLRAEQRLAPGGAAPCPGQHVLGAGPCPGQHSLGAAPCPGQHVLGAAPVRDKACWAQGLAPDNT
jgi:hypothetical protein